MYTVRNVIGTLCAVCQDEGNCKLLTTTTIEYGFWVTSKNCTKLIFDWNQLKLITQHKYMYMYMQLCIRKCNKNEDFFSFQFWQNWPQTMYYSTGTLARFLVPLQNS